MHAIIRAGVLAAAVLWATDSIALEPKRPDSLPALDLSCYIAQSVAFTTLENTGSELGIGGERKACLPIHYDRRVRAQGGRVSRIRLDAEGVCEDDLRTEV